MSRTINFGNRQIISKEELITWDEGLRELAGTFLKYYRAGNGVGGVLDFFDQTTNTFNNDFFKPEKGTVVGGYATLDIGAGKGILDIENTTAEFVSGLTTHNDSLKKQLVSLFKYSGATSIQIPGVAGYNSPDEIFVGFTPIFNPVEEGVCAISTNNQVTIVGGDFTKVRGQISKNPVKIKFVDGSGNPASNNQIYEVVSVIDSTNIVISGYVTTETDLSYIIVGSYDLAAQGNLEQSYLYVTATGKLEFNSSESYFVSNGGFVICSLQFTGAGVFDVVDLRESYVVKLSLPTNVMYTDINQNVSSEKTYTDRQSYKHPDNKTIDTVTFTTPLAISGGLLNIPASAKRGMIYKVLTTVSEYKLDKVYFDNGHRIGDHFYLYTDTTGQNLEINQIGGTASVTLNIAGEVLTAFPGSLLEFICLDGYVWKVLNSNLGTQV